MSNDILQIVVSLPTTSPCLAKVINDFLIREAKFHDGCFDLTTKLIRQMSVERYILEQRAYASYRRSAR